MPEPTYYALWSKPTKSTVKNPALKLAYAQWRELRITKVCLQFSGLPKALARKLWNRTLAGWSFRHEQRVARSQRFYPVFTFPLSPDDAIRAELALLLTGNLYIHKPNIAQLSGGTDNA